MGENTIVVLIGINSVKVGEWSESSIEGIFAWQEEYIWPYEILNGNEEVEELNALRIRGEETSGICMNRRQL